MSAFDVIRGTCWEDSSVTCLARIVGPDGNNATQSNVGAITCSVFDRTGTTPDVATQTPTVSVASAVYNALQTDSRWSVDSTGYNFAHTITPTGPATGEHSYRIVYTVTFTTAEVAKMHFQVEAKDGLRP